MGSITNHDYDAEHAVVARIRSDKASGRSSYAIARSLNAEGTRTRYGKEFTTRTVLNILARHK